MPPSDFPTPGLKRRPNKDGTERLVWVARADLVKAGYEPKTIRLHYAPDELALISSACQRHQAEMLSWATTRGDPGRRTFDGSIADLVRRYQTDPESPYKRVKWNTRRLYDSTLGSIERAFGKRQIGSLGLVDFRRWYDAARTPSKPDGPERTRKAHGIISMLRRIFNYGVAAELKGCQRCAAILAATDFAQPAPRRKKLELTHVLAVVAKAIEEGVTSIALGTAIQFETTMRQRDVIGEWEPLPAGDLGEGGIVLGRRRWANGLLWSHISAELVLRKDTTKTGAEAAHDLTLCPIVIEVLEMIPIERRVGPVIVEEKSGRPYAEWMYAREWRRIATLADVPADIWNMDARAGGISEADDAGAEIDMIRSAAAHSQATMTTRYIRSTIGKSRAVARLRSAHRIAKATPK